MPFRLFSKKQKPARNDDPIAVFDELIASVSRQGAVVRESAATLSTIRSQLKRDCEKYQSRIKDCQQRLIDAQKLKDDLVVDRLKSDAEEATRMAAESTESLARVEGDARQLMETAQLLAKQLAELKAERVSARTRMTAGSVTQKALKERSEEFDRVLKLDKARDDIERAHALAELYREDSKGRR